MEKVEEEINEVKAEIKKTQQEIDAISKQLGASGLSDSEKQYLYTEKTQLRAKEMKLHDKEMILRDEKNKQLESKRLGTISENENSQYSFTEMLQEVHSAVVKRNRATPQKTPASFGKEEYFRIEREGKVKVFKPIEAERSILSQGEATELSKLSDEHQIVAFLTPHFEIVFGQCEESATVVVNSEEYKWLQTSEDSTYSQKPDLFVCHKAIYKTRSPPKRTDETLLDMMRRGNHKFGVLADWRLRRFLYVVMEAKAKVGNQGLGEIINYGAHLSFDEDGPITTRLILFDALQFWLVECVKGTLSSILKCKWTDGGSFSLAQNFALYDPMIELLERACQDFGVTIDSDSFLGQGAFGLVFRVKNRKGKELALKIVPDEDDNLFELLKQNDLTLRAKEKCPDLVVGIENNGYRSYENLGGALLQSDVGEHYLTLSPRQIVDALNALHSENVLHGDCRVENVVNVNGQAQFIDFRASILLRSSYGSQQKLAEMKQLRESIARSFY
eukprot:scaffold1341_cov178-Amphora_coffeaeformis.AAC.42